MDFTREPIIETIITPKDGCNLVIRNSKGVGQEEYFVDAVEVVSFGHAVFFRSLERPKAFLVPISDYEVIEVREARTVLKNIGLDRSIKIGGGREGSMKAAREIEKADISQLEESPALAEVEEPKLAEAASVPEARLDKKRDRRRHYRKKRNGKEDLAVKEGNIESAIPPLEEGDRINIQAPEEGVESEQLLTPPITSSLLSSLLQPPPTLISETINRYRENALFRSAFFISEEEEQYKPHDKAQELLNEEDEFTPALQEPAYEPLEEPTLEMFEKYPTHHAMMEEPVLETVTLEQSFQEGLQTGEEMTPSFEENQVEGQDENMPIAEEENRQEESEPLGQAEEEESEFNLPYPAFGEEQDQKKGSALAEHADEEKSKTMNHMPAD